MSNPVQIADLETVFGDPPCHESDVCIAVQRSLRSVSFEMKEVDGSIRLAFLVAGLIAGFVVFVKIDLTAVVTVDWLICRYPSVFQELLVAVVHFRRFDSSCVVP